MIVFQIINIIFLEYYTYYLKTLNYLHYYCQHTALNTIAVVSTIVSGTCGIATLWAQTVLQVLLLPLFFILLSGMCVSIVASITMDVIPTQLR